MNFKQLSQSIGNATRGIGYVFRREQNFRLQLLAAFLALALAFVFGLNRTEMIAVLLLIFSVLILELLNSAIERFVDVIKPRLHFQVEAVKDIMAAAVLLASLGALVIGMIIFWPYFIRLF